MASAAHVARVGSGVARQPAGQVGRDRAEEAFDVRPIVGRVRRSGVDETADEPGQRVTHIVGQVGLRVVELEPLPGGVTQLGQLARREATQSAVADARQRERPRAMWLQRRLDRSDHVVARILAVQADVVAQYRAAPHVDDHQQPEALDLELLLETERVTHHDLEPDIESVAVELDDIQDLHCSRRGCAFVGHALEVGGAGEPRYASEAAQALRAHGRGQ